MSDIVVAARWLGGLRFEAVGKAGVPVLVDGDGEVGITPVETLAVALAGCMAADVVDILAKMRVSLDGLSVRLEGDRRPEPPRRYTALRFGLRAGGVPAADADKLRRAVDMSREKYCSVLHTLRPDLDFSVRIETD
ncbi:MAG TPA: OsmC family protein [Longimicrobiales bacterium]|nr:OsmC family protein [Longimicrobiales bacterium]